MRLDDLFNGEDLNTQDDAIGRIDITGVTCDSRRVQPGFVFAAFPGSTVDGRDYISAAVASGAAAVIVPDDERPSPTLGIPVVRDRDARHRYAVLAAALAGRQPGTVGAVTGTNGKTSVAWFARQLMNAAGVPAANAGTLGSLGSAPDGSTLVELPGALTTPDPADLHRDLHLLAEHGIDHLAIEASSHGLDQRRLDGVRVRAAAFTNLTRDHLDYHRTEDAYLTAKMRLFDTLVVDGGQAVVNADARFADAFIGAARRRGLEVNLVGRDDSCDVHLQSVVPHASGLDIVFNAFGTQASLTLPLVGGFQASNALVALGLVAALGIDVGKAVSGLGKLMAAPGRMQFCGAHPSGAGVFVDYAHTPDALETVLKSMRPHAAGRLHVVFGCGGDRDPGKRPLMGRAAASLADVVIITDDNPRTEDAVEIRRQILAGAPDAQEIGDRRAAINAAVEGLRSGDVLVVAGKGHERGQIVGTDVIPFDDAIEVARALAEVRP